MQYPLISEYIDAIRSAEDNFDKLTNLRPVLDSNGNPVMSSGNFAVVFKMKDVFNDRLFAVKCFIKEQEQRSEYYRLISEELNYVSSPYLLHVRYLERELFVCSEGCDEEEFPVLVMEWVEGQPLDAYLKQHLCDTYALQMLAYRFCKMGAWLLSQPFAHGDLKPDNILVREDGSLVLVDYDGMYVSAMEGREACELGSPDFRHPLRDKTSFDEHIDDFSIATIALSLKSIALSPQLYHQYAAADRLLFSANDYHDIGQSTALQAITALSSDSELSILLGVFLLSLAKKSLSLVSFRLLLLKEPEKPAIEVLSTNITDEERENAVEDEYGAKYTADGLKLIEVPHDVKDYIIKDGTRVIGDEAFFYILTSSLVSITIPNSVTSIGDRAFEDCKSHVEECLGLTVDTSTITEWLTTEQVFEKFGMKPTAIRVYAYRHRIPTKKEYGITYYSKTHLAELRQMDMMTDERYCTVDEVSEQYGLSKANIHHIAKVHGIKKRKVGVRNLLLRADVERAIAERAAKGL